MIEQRTDEWYAARSGRITASDFIDVVAVKRDGKPTEARGRLLRRKAFERLAGVPTKGISAKALEWGIEAEPHAVAAYEVETGNVVRPGGFFTHPSYPFIGASPDSLIGDEGGLECKCPHDETVHIQTLLDGMPAEHMPQVQGNLLVTGRAWWDFISYDPRQREPYRLYVQRIPRDEAYCQTLLAALLQFEIELKALIERIERRAA
ncbi:lambda exonuclease family protein [Pigmentiphaga sp. YJ18]|uniref:lambda exonuclease family protein n=1 Tax=Pigmentiphaga sp. YJ18 TaxID=3134907 RepID=UPI00310E4471